MYRDQMLSVGTIENGFIIEIHGKFKPEKKVDSDGTCCDLGIRHGEKEIFAKDGPDVARKIEALMPMLEVDEFDSEEAFDKAFNEAAKK